VKGHRRVKAVVFDFGGVLITPITNQLGAVAAQHDVPMTTMLEILLGPHLSGDHPWHRAERGELAVADIQPQLQHWADPHGVTLRGDEIDALLASGGYTVVKEMAAKVAQLKRDGVITGLLTNTFAEFRPTMERDLNFADFTQVVESFAVGCRKPEAKIYEATRELLGVNHDEILYLDDFVQNIAAAEAFGWSTIQVADPVAAVALIDAFL
jgi:putative hydrolase of the HAD superfamily